MSTPGQSPPSNIGITPVPAAEEAAAITAALMLLDEEPFSGPVPPGRGGSRWTQGDRVPALLDPWVPPPFLCLGWRLAE